MFQTSSFATSEVELHIARGPAHGAPLILLHGVVRRWQDFLPITSALSARWELLGVDQRGHGRSGHVERAYAVADYARDTVALLRHGIAEPAVIYGHSLGAMVALAAAAHAPDHVRALVLEDPPCETLGRRIQQSTYPQMFAAWQRLALANLSAPQLAAEMANVVLTRPDGTHTRIGDVRDETSLRFTASCLNQIDPDVLEPFANGTWYDGYDLTTYVSHVRCPVLILQADPTAGGMLSDDDATHLTAGLADAMRIRFPNTGHLIHWEAPDATLRHVLAFLESLGS